MNPSSSFRAGRLLRDSGLMRCAASLAAIGMAGAAPAAGQAPKGAEAAVSKAEVRAQAKAEAIGKVSAAFFLGLQELAPFTAEQMAERHETAITTDAEVLAADQALNDWKLCALDSITRWAEIRPGRGEIVDGAMGRCADIERDYRNHLTKMTQDGRFVLDLSFARQVTKSLEETWRPRILAAALDHDLEVARAEKEKGGRR